MSMSPRHRAISPPTPAPSPQPDLHTSIRLANNAAAVAAATASAAAIPRPITVDPQDPAQLLKHLSLVLPQFSQSARFKFISEFVDMLNMRELAHMSAIVTPRLKVDFLSSLPIEVSLNILSFIDDPKTLARASCVSRFWRSLVNDEHTWKVMCLKHKYRRRGSSNAGLTMLDHPYLRAITTPNLSSFSRLPPSLSRRTSLFTNGSVGPVNSLAAVEESPVHSHSHADDHYSVQADDDATVLASLYQRYRDRGLDPSNALHELRTLHDLFLSKQEGSFGSLSEQMSHTERAFYAQLEEIVQEESRARYGDPILQTQDESSDLLLEADLPSEAIASSSNKVLATPTASFSTDMPPSSNLGWLSAGPQRSHSSNHQISSSYRTADGRLDRLQGWQDSFPPSTSTPGITALGLRADDDSDHAMEMEMDDHHGPGAVSVTPDARVSAIGQPPNAPVLASLPHHDSPTSRFSVSGPSLRGLSSSASTSRSQPDSLVPGRIESRIGSNPREEDAEIAPVYVRASRPRNENDTDAKKARRRSAPLIDADTASTSQSSSVFPLPTSLDRSATLGSASTSPGTHRKSAKIPFSYRTHFKMAYLTESNWRKGGRLQTQHVSADAGHVVTSLAIDSEWIVVGMANSKIHVFSAVTGLYAHTLLGHDAGVWCLTLISRTGKKKNSESSIAASSSQAKGKMVVTDPEDGSGGKPYQAAADGDLRLVHHDPRPDAADVLFSPSSLTMDLQDGSSTRASSAGPSSAGKARPADGGDETLEWFHKARRAMLRQQGARTASSRLHADGYASGQGDSDADISVRSEGASEGSRGVRPSNVRSQEAKAREIAEAEAGAIRDAVMADGTGQVPADLADKMRRNSESDGIHATPPAAQHGGNALGLGNPCGSVQGYGNEDAIVVSGGCDRDVRVWDLKTGECKHVLHGHTSTVRCLKVLDGKPIAVSGSRDSTLRVWNVETGEHLHLLAGHQHSVRCIEVAGNKVASGSYDGTCRVWNLDTGRCLHTLRGHIHYIYAVAFDGQKVATGSLDSTVRVWSVETGECLALFQGHTSLVGQLQLLDNTLVTGGSDGRVIVFSLKTYECLHRLCAHDNSVTCLQFDDRYIITGGNDGRVKLWDFSTGKFIRELCEPCDQVWKVSYRDDKVVVLCKRGDKTCMDVITFRPAADEM